MADLSSDIYKISQFVEDIKSTHIEANEDTLSMGIFGHMNDIFSHELQNSIIMASENSNEIFVNRANQEQNIINHAMIAQVSDINSEPAVMDVLLGIAEDEFLANMVDNVLYIDSEIPLYIGEYEFHLDYTIKVTRNISSINGENIFVAIYEMDKSNTISDIDNPYLLPPYIYSIDHQKYVFIRCTIRQVELTKIYNKIITDDSIENKTFTFTFDSQLANFKVVVNDGTEDIELIPVFEGMPLEDPEVSYCYYNFVDYQTIRIIFIKESYEPSLNSDVTVHLFTSQGSDGNFDYSGQAMITPTSENYTYSNMTLVINSISDSEFGIDRKSIEDLKEITPRELLARKAYTTPTDLESFFNVLNDDSNRMVFLKKIDNQFERTYYSYILIKDSYGNIIPSNTGELRISADQFDSESDSRYIIKPGSLFKYNEEFDRMERDMTEYTDEEIAELEQSGFLYSTPYFIAVNKSPLTMSVYLTLFNRRYALLFNYINQNSFLQFIATRINWTRKLLENPDTYTLTMTLNQNSNEDGQMITLNEDGSILTNKMKIFAVVYNEVLDPIRYVEGEITKFDTENLTYDVEILFKTDDTILQDSNIRITNLYDLNTEDLSVAYLDPTGCKTVIHVLAQFDDDYGLNGLDTIIPNLDGYSLCNTYEVENGLDFFINFTDIVQSRVKVEADLVNKFNISSIPVVKYSFTQDSDRIRYLSEFLISRKNYIDEVQTLIADQFGVDFKFFNTYGPSKIFKIGSDKITLDKTNITLKFRAKFSSSAMEDIADQVKVYIKEYIEDINDINSMSISKLITAITNNFSDLEYIEFIGINDYDSSYQYIEKYEPEGYYIPEFININITDTDYNSDIQIELV